MSETTRMRQGIGARLFLITGAAARPRAAVSSFKLKDSEGEPEGGPGVYRRCLRPRPSSPSRLR